MNPEMENLKKTVNDLVKRVYELEAETRKDKHEEPQEHTIIDPADRLLVIRPDACGSVIFETKDSANNLMSTFDVTSNVVLYLVYSILRTAGYTDTEIDEMNLPQENWL